MKLLIALWKTFATIIAYCYDNPKIILVFSIITIIVEVVFD